MATFFITLIGDLIFVSSPSIYGSVWQQELKESSYSSGKSPSTLPALLFLRQSCPTILKFIQVLSKTFKVLSDFERVVLSSIFPRLARSEALKYLVPLLWNLNDALAGLNALARASKDWKSFRSREKAHGSISPPFWILTVEWSGVRSCLFWWLHRFSDSIILSVRPHQETPFSKSIVFNRSTLESVFEWLRFRWSFLAL